MPQLPIAVLVSGGGTTLRNLIAHQQAGTLSVDIRLVVSSSATAKGLQIADAAGISTLFVEKTKSLSADDFSAVIFAACRQAGVSLVAMGGFLKHLPVPPDFENRVVNIHPALIPAFCGRGMYGLHVHEAVLEFGAKVSGCTVHFVDNQYDHGPIIAQEVVPVLDDDTPETLQQRVFAAECVLYPRVLQAFAEGRVHVNGRRVCVQNDV